MNAAAVDDLEPDDELAEWMVAAHESLINTRLNPSTLPAPPNEDPAGDLGEGVHLSARQCLAALERLRRAADPSPTTPLTSGIPLFAGESPSLKHGSPERIGHFRILREAGRGGQGIVFLAEDTALGRQVALKVPRPETMILPEIRRRFVREAQAAARLTHPYIVAVHEAGEMGPICYLAADYCPGPTLATWLQAWEHRASPRGAAAFVARLADAIEYAHARNVIHRDLKPGNILLQPPSPILGGKTADPYDAIDELIPRLTDFGLAKLFESKLDETQSGVMLGTLAYMSPEQAEGRVRDIGPATDIYALGVILYELLTGRTPHRGASDADTLRRIVSDEPASPRKHRPDVPRDLAAICLRCLEKIPDRRYPTARDLREDLERFLRNEPTHARPPRVNERVVKWARRKPLVAALTAISAISILAVLILSLWGNARLSQLLGEADAARQETERYAGQLQQRVYAGDMRLASQAWENGHVARGRELLDRYQPKEGLPDPRGFEWWYLWRQFHQGSQVIAEHPGGANAVASAPANGTIATGGSDGTVKLLSSTGQVLHQFVDTAPVKVNHVALSRDGAILAAAYEDGKVRMWRTASWEEVHGAMRHQGWVAAVAISPDGTLLASAGEDHVVKLWSTADGSPNGECVGHTDTVRALAFHPQQGVLASAAEDGTVRVWDLKTRQPDSRLPSGMLPNSTGAWIRTLAFELDGTGLCGGSPNGELVQWDFREGHIGQVRPADKESSEPRRIAALSESRLAIGRADSRIRLTWAGGSLRTHGLFLRGHLDRIEDVAAGTNPNELLSASRDGTVRLWKLDASLGNVSVSIGPRVPPIFVWRDHWLVVASGLRGPIIVLEMPSGRVIRRIPTSVVRGVDVDPAKDQLVYADSEGLIRSVEVSTGNTRFEAAYSPILGAVILSPDGQLAAVSNGESVLVLDSATGTVRCEIPRHGKHTPMAWLAKKNRLVIGGDEGTLREWDALTGALISEHQVHAARITGLSTSSDKSTLATSSIDRTLKVWSTEDWQVRMSMTLDVENPRFLLMGDTPRLAMWNAESGLSIYDRDNGEQLINIPDRGIRNGVCVNPGGDIIVELLSDRLYIFDGRPQSD